VGEAAAAAGRARERLRSKARDPRPSSTGPPSTHGFATYLRPLGAGKGCPLRAGRLHLSGDGSRGASGSRRARWLPMPSSTTRRTSRLVWDALFRWPSRARPGGDEIYFPDPRPTPSPKSPAPPSNWATSPIGRPAPRSASSSGRTPLEPRPREIRPASPVNVFGKLAGDPDHFQEGALGDNR